MWRIVFVEPLPEYRLRIRFADGVSGIVDLSADLWGPFFEPLRDPARFAEVALGEDGVIAWPNGADLAADAIYEELTGPAS